MHILPLLQSLYIVGSDQKYAFDMLRISCDCCCVGIGAISELGPLSLFQGKESSPLYTGRLSDNPYSWNAYAHLVTVDQPRYVGFSTGSGTHIHSSIDAAKDIVMFITAWFDQYPEINRGTKVYIAGESYGGACLAFAKIKYLYVRKNSHAWHTVLF